jgi:abhydrolase domain-containing protein 12
MLSRHFTSLLHVLASVTCIYITFLALLATKYFQTHVVYLHALPMTWFKDVDTPEIFGFLHNQVTPFRITAADDIDLYAWHIVPIGLYRKHERRLHMESSGFVPDITTRFAFNLLRDDTDSRLVIHFHGAGGTVASGYRCPNYRALSAGDPNKIHVLSFDYRGFGRSPGTPSEQGLIADAVFVVDWALNIAKVHPSQIIMYSQSLGTAVNMAVAEHYALQDPPITFAGHILTAPFVDVLTLVSTYSIAGTIPILGPVTGFPSLFNYLKRFIRDQWSTKERIANYIRANEANNKPYQITLLHAQDDYDIPWTHTPTLFWHAACASGSSNLTQVEFDEIKMSKRSNHKMAGTTVEWKTTNGIIREEILKYGLHDVIMGNPTVSLAVMRMFDVSRDHSMLAKDTQ